MYNKFAKPTRPVKGKNGFKKGVAVSQEYNGSSSGVHTIALGSCSIPSVKVTSNIDSPWFLIAFGIMKRIFKKHYGVNVTHAGQAVDTLLPPVFRTQSVLPAGLETKPKLIAVYFYHLSNNDGDLQAALANSFDVTMPLSSAADRTFGTMCFDLASKMRAWYGINYGEGIPGGAGTNYTVRNFVQLYGYTLEEMISLTTTSLTDPTNRHMSQIHRLDNWIMDMKYVTKIRIQNVSAGQYENGGTYANTTNLDHAETNMLVGKIYHFKDPYPIESTKILTVTHALGKPTVATTTANGIFSKDTTGDGLIKPNSSATVDTRALRHIPTPDCFKNVASYSLFKLAPGENKSYKQYFRFNGYINKLIHGLMATVMYDASVAGNPWVYAGRVERDRGFGTCDMFFFEDYNGGHIDSATNPGIAISYQVNRFGTCAFVKQTHEGTELVRSYDVPYVAVQTDV